VKEFSVKIKESEKKYEVAIRPRFNSWDEKDSDEHK
jgi:hypothetical protein